jgi:hypothetical protein
MKKTWLLLFFLGCSTMPLFSQTPLDARVSLEVENMSLETALYLLVEQSKVKLSFSNSIIPNDKRVTIKAENESLRTVLDQLLKETGVEYRVSGSQVVLVKKPPAPNPRHSLYGFIIDAESGERIPGAVIYERRSEIGTYANEFGYFSITLERGPVNLVVSNLGYEIDTFQYELTANTFRQVKLKPAFLTEIIVNSFADSIFLETSLSATQINMEQASRLASLGGETDIFRLIYALPGIQTGTDGFGGISVRGGNVDQNLFLLDGVPVYNALHGIGIYSIYNSSAIRSATVLKGSFPAQYGGRLSSVWDIQTKEGNSNQLQGEAELGLSSAQLSLEGPFAQKKGSFFVSGRRALFDFFSEPISRRLRKKDGASGFLSYYFYDLNAKINYRLTRRDQIYLSFYKGKDNFIDNYDQFRWFQDTLSIVTDRENVIWGNNVSALRWNHVFSEKLFANATLTFSQYFYRSEDFIDVDLLSGGGRISRDVLVLKYDSDIRDVSGKMDFDYLVSSKHRLRFGASATNHNFQPGIISFDQATTIDSIQFDTLGEWNKIPLRSHEFDAYLQDEMKIGDFIQANIGLRAAALTVNDGHHLSLQPRLLLNFFQGQKLSLHVSAGRVTQFLHLLSPTNIGLPKDLWVSATERVPPQHSWQFVAGAKRKLGKWFSLELETYRKTMQNLVYFQGSGLDRINSVNWQNNVSLGKGWSYGVEVLLKMESSKAGGWLSYTLSKSDRQFGKDVNNGKKFPHRLDRRHNLNLQFLYKLNPRWDFAASFTLATGTAFTFPTAQYELVQPPSGGPPTDILPKSIVIDELNGDRYPIYHKLDLAVNHYFMQRNTRHTIKLGVYNAYFRQNPLYYTIRDSFDEEGVLHRKVIQVSLLPVFPTLRYIMEFK